MLSSDDLCISRLSGAKPTGIYVILPDERPIFHKLAGILCSQILSHYIRSRRTNTAANCRSA